MTKLEELIKEHCPNGVEYRKLSEIVKMSRGVRVVRSQLTDDGRYPVFQNSMTPLGYYSEYNCPKDTVFLISAGAAGEIGYSDTPFWAADDCWYFECGKNLIGRFLYYALACKQEYIFSRVRKASVPRLSRNVIDMLQIPLPPLAVQREIVRILDKFTLYSQELAAELAARRVQYNYYRDRLLSFNLSTQRVPLKEIFNTRNGYTPSTNNKDFWQGNIPWFRVEDIRLNGRILNNSLQHISESAVKGKLFPANSIIVSTSATIGEHALITCESVANQRFTYLMLKERYKSVFNIKFLFYYCYIFCFSSPSKFPVTVTPSSLMLSSLKITATVTSHSMPSSLANLS